MKILGIETSCDETGIALYDGEQGLLAHDLFSQVEIHAEYGGVVPELASRDHIRKVLPLIESVLASAGITRQEIDGIAYTRGPGLVGALMVGATVARTMAWALKIPALGVHHMEGHLLAPMLEETPPEFPFVGLLVSGGHTLLIDVQGIGQYRILGESVDDAVGEAFDKTAKMLGLGYPGGPALAKLAQQGQEGAYKFPRPMTDRPGLDFSFSGLKTFALNTLAKSSGTGEDKANIARAFEQAVADTFFIKCRRALEQTGHKRLVVAGGVGANMTLRQRLKDLGVELFFPAPEFCTDNGAMIAYAGYRRLAVGQSTDAPLTVQPRWSLEELLPID